jgi:tRNA pseudouridine38-40 synthase
MTLWALRLEYDGTGFSGWQRQAKALSVQQVLEEAAAKLAGGTPCPSIVAGRTDAGVHAEGQVAQLALPDRFDARAVRQALNFHMKPHAVVVLEAAPAPPTWNARFSAIGRRYRYVILNRPSRPALALDRVWHVPRALDAAAMAAGAAHLLGRHDFTSFRAASCQAKSPLRTLERLDVAREGERIVIHAEARSFLHHQVRNMVGTLKLVGEGTWAPARVATALAAADRKAAGPTAPPEGLALMAVVYPETVFARP